MSDRNAELAHLRSAIDRAAQLYYAVRGDQVDLESEHITNTDEEYDALIDELRRQCPDDPRLTRIGAPYTPASLRDKTEHSIPMGSLDNTEGGISGFAKWYHWVVEQFDDRTGLDLPSIHLSLKMDGSSVAAYYEKGLLKRVVGRGNGEVGEDLTANAACWRHIPTSLPRKFTGAVRGEAMLYSGDFDKVNEENGVQPDEVSNARNVGNGILGRSDGRQSEYIQFIAFNLAGDRITHLGTKLSALKMLGFSPVSDRIVEANTEMEMVAKVGEVFEEIRASRSTLPFAIDGIVVCLDKVELQERLTRDRKDCLRPRYARAIKFETAKNETIVKGVTITVGHTGAIIPTADLEPVRVGGVTVDSALLNNWNANSQNPTAAHVKIGDTVEVELAGDIIPKICRVIVSPPEAETIEEPVACVACGAPTTRTHRGKTGVVTYCSEPESCQAAAAYRLKHYIGSSKKGLGILGIGDSVLHALIDAGLLKSPADLYRLRPLTSQTEKGIEELTIGQNAEGKSIRLGSSRAMSIVREIEKAKHVPLTKFLGALGIDLLGRRRVEILAKQCGLRTLNDWLEPSKLALIPGDTIRTSIIEGLQKARPIIDELREVGVEVADFDTDIPISHQSQQLPAKDTPTEVETMTDNAQFAGKTFCFTGTRALIDQVEARGGILKSGISKGLDFLVQKDPTSKSNKTRKAEEYGTKIIGLATLEAVLKGERSLP